MANIIESTNSTQYQQILLNIIIESNNNNKNIMILKLSIELAAYNDVFFLFQNPIGENYRKQIEK